MLIRIVDLETTGFEPPAEVIEVGWSDLMAGGRDLAGEPTGWTVGPPSAVFVRPATPIPPETSAIHHIIDEDVTKGANWRDFATAFFSEPDIVHAAHSCKFERLWITDEITGGQPWICTYKCALRLWPDAPSHSNQALRYWRRPVGLVREIAHAAHRAGPDAYVTAHLLREMLESGATVEQLIQWSSEPALQVRCHIGKVWRGHKWTEVDDGFLQWVFERDFDEDVIFTVRHEMARRAEERRLQINMGERLDEDGVPF